FLVQHGELHTPSLDCGCLDGVMRGLVIELCRAEGLPIHEAPLPLHALADSSEAFLTSSIREVHSISRVDGRTLSNVVGPLTKRVEELLRRLVCENVDP
ncbi:MAG: aminotransferase class IV, partial [Verrucomicrobiaceae bacterium]